MYENALKVYRPWLSVMLDTARTGKPDHAGAHIAG